MKSRMLSDIYGHRTSAIWIAVTQNLLELAVSLTLRLTFKIVLSNAGGGGGQVVTVYINKFGDI
jgi:hypothetical protein